MSHHRTHHNPLTTERPGNPMTRRTVPTYTGAAGPARMLPTPDGTDPAPSGDDAEHVDDAEHADGSPQPANPGPSA